MVVPKPDCMLWLCNDFQKLDEVSEFDSYPMPWVDTLIERLGRPWFISRASSDCLQHHIGALAVTGSPLQMMDIVLHPHCTHTVTYLDDIVIHSATWRCSNFADRGGG